MPGTGGQKMAGTNKETSKIRIIAIYRMVVGEKKITAGEIMRRLQSHYGITVDRKTIYSDMAAIDRFIPLEITKGIGGGYSKIDFWGREEDA
jgi:predicted DNA-binding transcriptional regulator YafY